MAKKGHIGSFVVYALAGALAAVILLVAGAAMAQTMCGLRDAIVKNLEQTYSEESVAIGLASNGGLIEVFASPSGSFTIILTQTNGFSCVMATGEDFEPRPALPDTPF